MLLFATRSSLCHFCKTNSVRYCKNKFMKRKQHLPLWICGNVKQKVENKTLHFILWIEGILPWFVPCFSKYHWPVVYSAQSVICKHFAFALSEQLSIQRFILFKWRSPFCWKDLESFSKPVLPPLPSISHFPQGAVGVGEETTLVWNWLYPKSLLIQWI